MTIRKVLNNNVIVSVNGQGEEIVAMGKGLAFNRRVGEIIDEAQVEKVFVLANKEIARKFQQVLADIPVKHFLIAEKIIDYAKSRYGKKLGDGIYVSLTDHVNTAIDRYSQGLTLKNPLVMDIKRFYKDEFEIGETAVSLLREETGLDFLIDEAGFIALHFVNAELGDNMAQVYEITEIIEGLTSIVKKHFGIECDEESIMYFRFVTHLKFFAQRLLNGIDFVDDDGELFEMVKRKYADSYACTEKIEKFILEKYKHTISKEERMYLTIHIERVTKNTGAADAAIRAHR